jgi:molybdenum cofactor biosynthesis enzyme MoaA
LQSLADTDVVDHVEGAVMSKDLDVPVRYKRNRKIRLKLTDWCNLECPFCHSEGAAGANEISLDDPGLIESLRYLRSYYDYIHLTGGEPTSYRHLDEVVEMAHSLDFKVAMTSNGLFNLAKVQKAALRLEYINISFHTISPAYFDSFVKSAGTSQRIIDTVSNNIAALSGTIPLRINTVISGSQNEQHLEFVHEFAERHSLPLKLVPDWRSAESSRRFAIDYLRSHGFRLSEIIKIVPGSNVRKIFSHPGRISVELKDIEHFRPDFLCRGCTIMDKCVESFSFLRIERSPAKFRLCIYKPELAREEFFATFVNHLRPLLEAEPWDA